MKRFEYTSIGHVPSNEELNIMGKEGWELCTYVSESYISSHVLTKTDEMFYFKREITDIDYAGLLIGCSYRRGVSRLQHRTIAEFAQFVEDVMSSKHNVEMNKYKFDINDTDAIRTWIVKFHEYCKEYYDRLGKESYESE